ncbi:MAG: substrate-binding domain-containing protein [Acidobacteria bacterium]|nr:substrate-binding domain-containing protein [Acidobacteriota bacterium]
MTIRRVTPLLFALLLGAIATPAIGFELRVCADPNNLPFSNDRLHGFENRIASVLAREMGTTVRYTWWAQRRGFVRNTLKAGLCDVVLGVPAGLESVLATRPYYRSTYVWVSRRSREAPVTSFDDPRLARKKIGVQLVGDDYANTPPAHALMRRGLIGNVVGFTLYGDYSKPNPPARILEAVAAGEVDVALVWGPLAGYFASRSGGALRIVPAAPPADLPDFPFAFDIAMGVRRGDKDFKTRLDLALLRRRAEIDRILDSYGVPRVRTAPAPRADVAGRAAGADVAARGLASAEAGR